MKPPTLSLNKALVVEDQSLYRSLISERLRDMFDAVLEAVSAKEAVELTKRHRPTFVLIDILLPNEDGIELAERILDELPETRLLIVSQDSDPVTLYRVFRSGVHGFLDKRTEGVQALLEACSHVATGNPYFSKTAVEIRRELRDDPTAFYRVLSPRELDLMPDLCAGDSNEEISLKIGVKPSTVLWHRRNIMRKLQLHSTTELMQYGARNGFWKIVKGQQQLARC